jgi:mannosyltransferase OCH1-like enzyme
VKIARRRAVVFTPPVYPRRAVFLRVLKPRRRASASRLSRYRQSQPRIPPVFHQVWLGPDDLPGEFEPYTASWRRFHPGWEVRLWREANLPDGLRTPAVYDRERQPVERADILRLELLWRFGGIYLDLDMECLRPIAGLVEELDFFGTEIKAGRVTNTVIGAAPLHPILDQALSELKLHEPGARFDKSLSGPLFFASVVERFPDVTTFSPELFYPVTPEQRKRAFAVHHAARLWKDADEWRDVALRFEAQLREAQLALEEERLLTFAEVFYILPTLNPPPLPIRRKATPRTPTSI